VIQTVHVLKDVDAGMLVKGVFLNKGMVRPWFTKLGDSVCRWGLV